MQNLNRCILDTETVMTDRTACQAGGAYEIAESDGSVLNVILNW